MAINEPVGALQQSCADAIELPMQVDILVKEALVDLGESSETQHREVEHDVVGDPEPDQEQGGSVDDLVELKPREHRGGLHRDADAAVGPAIDTALVVNDIHQLPRHPSWHCLHLDLADRTIVIVIVRRHVRIGAVHVEDDVHANNSGFGPGSLRGIQAVGELGTRCLDDIIEGLARCIQGLGHRKGEHPVVVEALVHTPIGPVDH
mmetsp:Transcript_17966/g.38336  ORF Transcript_17966/g.38336 Transcript_17966/m.38336 type:complete len:206 (-) Transcript_17966:675-1292(-)